MNNKKLKTTIMTTLFGLTLGAGSFSAMADKVNCRMETTSQKNIYSGTAQCTGTFWYTTWENKRIVRKQGSKSLQQYFDPTPNSSAILSGIAYVTTSSYGGQPLNESFVVKCSASIPFSHKEDVKEEVCDNTPTAYVGVNHHEFWDVSFWASGRDEDGTIVSKELWIDGVKQSSSSVWKTSSQDRTYNIRVRVTDNDGYSSEATRTYRATNKGPLMCGKYPC
ncbi:hypothetical protein [Pseudoalteromonas luteoviolacea]|uniref:hypothetical protein n=1 Tax=Pseudoalteromonas luteoviolacea TaxID=43657 RepID=UPI001B38C424|nr:hypothetical protein [Pseudoalteromonas luteoviolacea]MBQ4837343.1 hypothetical protein [Pseudoalteromonas luteoviolacea]